MRLASSQIAVIKKQVAKLFGPSAGVWLFGSRVDDQARGGDIDLFIDTREPVEDPMMRSVRLNGALQQAFGAQKIDVVVHQSGQSLLPIHREALEKGVKL